MYSEINTKYRIYISNWLLFMLFLIATMIVIGGLTRLTDSGLSITEWEFFKGFFPPFNNDAWLEYFESYNPVNLGTITAPGAININLGSIA